MVRMSKHHLDEQLRARLLERLLQVMTGARSGSRAVALRELMSDDEQMQFAKRLAIVVMLSRGVSCRAVAQALGVSLSTVAHHNALRRGGRYESIERRASSSKRISMGVANFVTDFLEIALMPYCGAGRKKMWQKYIGGGKYSVQVSR